MRFISSKPFEFSVGLRDRRIYDRLLLISAIFLGCISVPLWLTPWGYSSSYNTGLALVAPWLVGLVLVLRHRRQAANRLFGFISELEAGGEKALHRVHRLQTDPELAAALEQWFVIKRNRLDRHPMLRAGPYLCWLMAAGVFFTAVFFHLSSLMLGLFGCVMIWNALVQREILLALRQIYWCGEKIAAVVPQEAKMIEESIAEKHRAIEKKQGKAAAAIVICAIFLFIVFFTIVIVIGLKHV